MKDRASNSVSAICTRNDKISGRMATGGIACVAQSGNATFPRKSRCKGEHSFIFGAVCKVCAQCGYEVDL